MRRRRRPSAPNAVPTHLRKKVLHRDGHACVKCGATSNLEINHIHGRAEGGDDSLTNLETLCAPCHEPITAAQIARGKQRRAARRRLPTDPHPGRL